MSHKYDKYRSSNSYPSQHDETYEYEYPLDNEMLSTYDHDKDGTLSNREVELSRLLHDIEVKAKKLEGQKRMAWVSLAMIGLVTFFLFTPAVSDSRINALSDLLGLFYISCAGITGAYVGITTWISKRG